MKKPFLRCSALLLALHSASAFAVNLNGNWTGSGKISDNQGLKTACESMLVSIVHTATVLNVSTTFTCGGEKADAPGGNLEIRGGDLFENGAKIGTITANSVVISVKDSEHSLNTISLFTEKEMTFHAVNNFASDPDRMITFEGKVTRK